MAQVALVTVTAERRPLFRALRPLLLLGGFAALWWVLMTGSAQATSGPDHHELRDTLRSASATVHRAMPVTWSPTVRRIVHVTESRTTPVVPAVRRGVVPVTRAVTAPVRSALAKPPAAHVAQRAQGAVHRPIVSGAPAPDRNRPPASPRTAPAPPEAPEAPAASAPAPHAAPSSTRSAATPERSSAAPSPGHHRTWRHAHSPSPTPLPAGAPPASEHCPSGPSGPATPTAARIAETPLLVAPSTVPGRHAWRVAGHSDGPSHLPACSPD